MISNSELSLKLDNILTGHQGFVDTTINWLVSQVPTVIFRDPYTAVETTVKTPWQLQQDYETLLGPTGSALSDAQDLLTQAQAMLTAAQTAQTTFDSYDTAFQGYVSTSGSSAANAALSEASALNSATAAGLSETAAAASATTASDAAATSTTNRTDSIAAATAADASRVVAEAAETDAQDHRDTAQLWAVELEDTAVIPGFFSAYHWARKAEASAATASGAEAAASVSEANAASSEADAASSATAAASSQVSASSLAFNASNSATAAAIHASSTVSARDVTVAARDTTLTYRNEAETFRDQAATSAAQSAAGSFWLQPGGPGEVEYAGAIRVQEGSAASPTVKFGTATNSGLYGYQDETLSIALDGTTALTVSREFGTQNRVHIGGSSSPILTLGSVFELRQSGTGATIRNNDQGGMKFDVLPDLAFDEVDYLFQVQVDSSGYHDIWHAGNLPLKTDNKDFGWIGIGADLVTPAEELHVHGSDADAAILLTTSASGQSSTDGLYVGATASNSIGWIWNYEDADLVFGANNQEVARFAADGVLTLAGDIETGFDTLANRGRQLRMASSSTGSDMWRVFAKSPTEFRISSGDNGGVDLVLTTDSVDYTQSSLLVGGNRVLTEADSLGGGSAVGQVRLSMEIDTGSVTSGASVGSNNGITSIKFPYSTTNLTPHWKATLPDFWSDHQGGDVTLRVILSSPNSGAATENIVVRLDYAALTAGQSLPSSYTQTPALTYDISNQLFDTVFAIDLTIPAAAVSSSIDIFGFRIYRLLSATNDTFPHDIHLHGAYIVYNGLGFAP